MDDRIIKRCDKMKWSEVRELHPNEFVLLEIIKEHIDGKYKYVDEVSLIEVIKDNKEFSSLLARCKGDRFVYHTSNEYINVLKYVKEQTSELCLEAVKQYGYSIKK